MILVSTQDIIIRAVTSEKGSLKADAVLVTMPVNSAFEKVGGRVQDPTGEYMHLKSGLIVTAEHRIFVPNTR